ncbi:uncharacterized protein naf1 isoform X2 [Vanacampus margaritifer]
MDDMLLKKNEQIERSSNEMDMAFQLETLVTSHSVETQEQPGAHGYVHTVSATAIPSLARECNMEGLGGEVSEDSESDSSSSSSSFSSAAVFDNAPDDDGLNQPAPIKTKDEFLPEVFEVFGPVSRPLYIMRFNSPDDLSSKGLTLGLIVYYAPDMKEYTGYILLQQLKLLKGSDASWKNDQEPPEEALDYSDDEKEQQAKRKLKNPKKQHNTESLAVNSLQPHHVPQRRTGAPFRHRNVNNNQPPFRHSNQPPVRTDVPPGYHAHSCVYPTHAPAWLYPPHPPPPLSFPLFPPPPFFSPSYTSPLWLPNSVPFSKLPPPPPPPPPPPQ